MILLINHYIKALHKIFKAKNILLVTHRRPDGDALASISAMMELCIGMEKKFSAYSADPAPAHYHFLPHVEKIVNDKNQLDFSSFDLIIALDCGSLDRTTLSQEISERSEDQFVIEFDHHPRVDEYSDLEIRYLEASSTAEILYYFFKGNNIKFNKNLANCILTGILTDTGNFLYPSTTDETIKIASKMLLHGARFPVILEHTWRNKSMGGMKIWGQAMSNLQINKKYNIAFTVLTREDINRYQVSDEELEGVSGFLSNLSDVNALLFLREEDNGRIKGSLRTSHPKIDISRLATHLGGGGHPKASGFMLKGKLEKTKTGWQIN
ncbi:MAG: MgpA protein [Candidatus Falkowbacteria bacterium GW2011_GWC2_38_22]|uniref:MgpA protein n=1 Tax=Candidatus Falkowbacteria bacterium GW2011_GWE1_38_31 TaxID=1618638 RepID=A0A0G0JU71_9BACT|nr:MAG: MgpA protein [Candidatus Falkowbacteria bacterium GW2011_GWF2_38_1205]KKQ61028.1 MAG: MgpA protein [Candidatus Falkowbacteria bacterium GW2011_GWC2_38_22]KKQ63443.1 MAG: MgpA protein [Candidatus Falkowbacteria bacterium GW2011_GWF1_38_22]KKQ65486.1 MAG: MgpA protein [Candidatus Falkowbacteria bacterium GW2011_GWE2_38_254]KKQ70207.1 MAG: MgpA protein [Candidatus Falkowbacteria bacterium GW2011_GWE1_38_31]KKQ72617.1 MAG: MgpA protein [Candidatus Falkowbacteria bacterium GW2011_GWD2_38_42